MLEHLKKGDVGLNGDYTGHHGVVSTFTLNSAFEAEFTRPFDGLRAPRHLSRSKVKGKVEESGGAWLVVVFNACEDLRTAD
jgi:hypothetical protein